MKTRLKNNCIDNNIEIKREFYDALINLKEMNKENSYYAKKIKKLLNQGDIKNPNNSRTNPQSPFIIKYLFFSFDIGNKLKKSIKVINKKYLE